MGRRKGKTKLLFDEIDLKILSLLGSRVFFERKKISIGELRDAIGLTHANLNTHLKRLAPGIERKREKQTIYLSLNTQGYVLWMMMEHIDRGVDFDTNPGKKLDEEAEKLLKNSFANLKDIYTKKKKK